MYKVTYLELVSFVEPLVPFVDPVENSVERSKYKTVLERDDRTLE